MLGSLLDHIAQGTGLGLGTGLGSGGGVSVLPPAVALLTESDMPMASGAVIGSLHVEEAAVVAAKGQVNAHTQGLDRYAASIDKLSLTAT